MNEPFRRRRIAWPNLLACGYTVLGWPLGVWLLTRAESGCNVIGLLLTTHSLTCSAYLLHDCIHRAVFAGESDNDRFGVLLGWINGACLGSYAQLKRMHLRHHSDRLDVVSIDYRAALNRGPGWCRSCILLLEWAYVPAVELLMRALVAAVPFRRGTRSERLRVLWVGAARLAFFAGLAWVSVKAVLLYAMAYLLFLSVLRFFDTFQHTYEVDTSSVPHTPAAPRRDLRYEYENTYSNLLSRRWPWLNLLVLNFPYHNAHHTRPGSGLVPPAGAASVALRWARPAGHYLPRTRGQLSPPSRCPACWPRAMAGSDSPARVPAVSSAP